MNQYGRDVQSPIEVTVGSNNEVKVISSLEVAGMVGREHKNVMRDIQDIIEDLDELNIEPISYFIETTYKDSMNRSKPCYLLTKTGCELYGNRMTGIEGTAFTVKYIDRFNQMEQIVFEQPKLTRQQLAEQLMLETSKDVDALKEDVRELRIKLDERMTIDYAQQQALLHTKNKRVEQLHGDGVYDIERSKMHRKAWSDYKRAFAVASYKDTLTKDFNEGLKWLQAWRPLI